MADKDKMAKYRTEIQQVSVFTLQSQISVLFCHVDSSLVRSFISPVIPYQSFVLPLQECIRETLSSASSYSKVQLRSPHTLVFKFLLLLARLLSHFMFAHHASLLCIFY